MFCKIKDICWDVNRKLKVSELKQKISYMKLIERTLTILLFTCMYFAFGQQDQEAIAHLIFEKTNGIRKAKGLPLFRKLDSLDFLAQYHSENMVKKKFYDHTDHEGLGPVERAKKLKIKAWRKVSSTRLIGIAENIAQVPWSENVIGCGDTRSNEAIAKCLVQGWENSPRHYKNILGDYINLGVAIKFNLDQTGFATQIFR
tara:strand:+ start:17121 stop:17723 length:603 start_codon:yes stop_codon:yes gene_type:complete